MFWQRQLDEDTINFTARIEIVDDGGNLSRCNVRGEVQMLRDYAQFLGSPDLAAHINVRRRVLADADGREARRKTMRFTQVGDFSRDLGFYRVRDRLSA